MWPTAHQASHVYNCTTKTSKVCNNKIVIALYTLQWFNHHHSNFPSHLKSEVIGTFSSWKKLKQDFFSFVMSSKTFIIRLAIATCFNTGALRWCNNTLGASIWRSEQPYIVFPGLGRCILAQYVHFICSLYLSTWFVALTLCLHRGGWSCMTHNVLRRNVCAQSRSTETYREK